MTSKMIEGKIEGYNLKISEIYDRINNRIKKEISDSIAIKNLGYIEAEIIRFSATLKDSLGEDNTKYIRTKRRLKNLRHGIKSDFKLISTYEKYISKYEVEFYKKYSIPFASMVFVLIGASLGIITRRKGFAMNIALSLGFFVFYWAFLIAGEQLADRGTISPFMSMWLPNIILGILGLYLIYINSKDRKKIRFEMFNLLFKRKKKNA